MPGAQCAPHQVQRIGQLLLDAPQSPPPAAQHQSERHECRHHRGERKQRRLPRHQRGQQQRTHRQADREQKVLRNAPGKARLLEQPVEPVDAWHAEQKLLQTRGRRQQPLLQNGRVLFVMRTRGHQPQALLDAACLGPAHVTPPDVRALDQQHHRDEGEDRKEVRQVVAIRRHCVPLFVAAGRIEKRVGQFDAERAHPLGEVRPNASSAEIA